MVARSSFRWGISAFIRPSYAELRAGILEGMGTRRLFCEYCGQNLPALLQKCCTSGILIQSKLERKLELPCSSSTLQNDTNTNTIGIKSGLLDNQNRNS
jgi:hypothetical protein